MGDDNIGINPEVLNEKKFEEQEVLPEQDFEKAMEGVEEFDSNNNRLDVEAKDNNLDQDNNELGEEYNSDIAAAAALINYGLNAAAREIGVENTVQKIKNFDASGREDPIKDLFEHLGVDLPVERKAVQEEGMAARAGEEAFRQGVNAPTQRRSVEGAFKALEDMKELIAEVEGADPRYEELREGARAANKGYFEYAVMNFGVQGLTELFSVLAMQRKKAEAEETDYENQKEEKQVSEVEQENKAKEAGVIPTPNRARGPEAESGGEQLNPEILKVA